MGKKFNLIDRLNINLVLKFVINKMKKKGELIMKHHVKSILKILAVIILIPVILGCLVFGMFMINVGTLFVEETPAVSDALDRQDKATRKKSQEIIINDFNNNYEYFDKIQKYASPASTALYMWRYGEKLRATTDADNKHDIEVPINTELAFLIDKLGYFMVYKRDWTENGGYCDEIHFSLDDSISSRFELEIIYNPHLKDDELSEGMVKIKENWYYHEWKHMPR